jgi:hypothetical protein
MHVLADAILMFGAAVLMIAALWHFYWALGGHSSRGRAVPQLSDGRPLFFPGRLSTFAVATCLTAFAALFLLEARHGIAPAASLPVEADWNTVAVAAVSLVVLARAIGEFKYVGFFKRQYGTPFAAADTRFYSPLCLALGIAGIASAATTRYL